MEFTIITILISAMCLLVIGMAIALLIESLTPTIKIRYHREKRIKRRRNAKLQ